MPSDVAAARDDLGEFFTKWASACAPPDGSTVRPIIVAVSGGASRAAVWGASVLQKVEEASPTGHGPTVFAVSSVSGGSLGVAAYMALLRNLPADQLCAQGSTDARKAQMAWLGKMPLAHDALGPLLAATVAVDAPRALLSPFAALVRWMSGSQPWGGDRAEWIERAFEGIWKDATPQPDGILFDAPFLSLFYDGPHRIRPGMPIWIANGTETGTGGTSFHRPVRAGPRGLAVPRRPRRPRCPQGRCVDFYGHQQHRAFPLPRALRRIARTAATPDSRHRTRNSASCAARHGRSSTAATSRTRDCRRPSNLPSG